MQNCNKGLSTREIEIMHYAMNGFSAKEISCKINRCQRTVEQHLATIKIKLKARNIAHAVALFIKNVKNTDGQNFKNFL